MGLEYVDRKDFLIRDEGRRTWFTNTREERSKKILEVLKDVTQGVKVVVTGNSFISQAIVKLTSDSVSAGQKTPVDQKSQKSEVQKFSSKILRGNPWKNKLK